MSSTARLVFFQHPLVMLISWAWTTGRWKQQFCSRWMEDGREWRWGDQSLQSPWEEFPSQQWNLWPNCGNPNIRDGTNEKKMWGWQETERQRKKMDNSWCILDIRRKEGRIAVMIWSPEYFWLAASQLGIS